MKAWGREHAFALRGAAVHLRRSPAGFLLNVLVVAIALALPFAGLTLLENVRPMSKEVSVAPDISLFAALGATREETRALAPRLRTLLERHDARIAFVPREEALASLKEQGGLEGVLDTLGDNPLPDSYVVTLAGYDAASDGAGVDRLADQMRALPGVAAVQVDSAWVRRLAALLHILRTALLLLALTLGTVVVAVIFNTIRLQVMTQRDEIAVSRLLGATDNFIRRPFYYTGALLGLSAGAVALAAVALSLRPLNSAIGDFAQLYGSAFQLSPLGWLESITLLAFSATLGLLGAGLSVKRHLADLH